MRPLIVLMTLLAVILGAAATATAAPGEGPPAGGSIGIKLLDVPIDAADDPRAFNYIVDNLPPGTTIQRRVLIANNTGSERAVEIYPGAAKLKNGQFILEDRGKRNELTTWMSMDKSTVVLANGETAEATVTIGVPADAPPGEQYAVVWAQVTTDGVDGAVNSASRVGVRAYISVGPGNGPAADFEIDGLTPERGADGSASVVAEITNTGGRAVDLGGELILANGPGGATVGPVEATVTTLAPGERGRVTFLIQNSTQLSNGPWRAQVKLQSGLIEHEFTGDITFPESGIGSTVGNGSSDTPWLWIGIAGVAAAAAAGAVGWALWQRNVQAGA
ncbi:hypothetical protein JO861_16695 [Rhodococcus hoagii]|uniref:hypothetical protein n=1 Tax=Rhodococcus hoagii TaxID=43767 RepID=UPI0019666D9D|nr:hypothetical protein [Prescottella equi]MBM9838187.1 hypothetical protein [Prescottella equi]